MRARVSRPQNRINRLLIEKERANKRIAETRRRTAEIEKLQQRNARAAAAREDATAWLDSEQSLQKELMQQERAHREAAIANSRTTMYSLRKDEVSVLKKMREENEKAVQAQRELEHQRAKERKEMVLNSQKAAQARKEEEQKRGRRHAHQRYAHTSAAHTIATRTSAAHTIATRTLAPRTPAPRQGPALPRPGSIVQWAY